MYGGYEGWSGNGSVTDIDIPQTRTISENAFYNCASLTNLTIPNAVQVIGASAFQGCGKLSTALDFSRARNIGASAFYGCGSLPGIDISSVRETIAAYTFQGCSGLASITIPDTVEMIGDRAFYDCYGLQEVTIPISAQYAADGRAWNNVSLNSFYNCSKVQKITYTVGNGSVFATDFSDSLPYYARNALLTVEFEEGITEIPARALGSSYYNCSNVTSVKLPSTVKIIGASAFLGCAGLTDVYYMAREAQWKAVTINTGNERLTAARIHFIMDGDVNGSCGAPDAGDMQCLYTYLTSGEIVGAYQNNADMFIDLADVNRDGTVDVYDLQRLYEAVSGINAFADVSAQ